ncbi:MAG: rhamnulokinase [Verrucomicrobia bacterium]|nr:MAG: rhamnulokinase [Verrucomicrobiota bacterium]
MAEDRVYIAVDLGAGSGRVIAARANQKQLALEEIHRFENPGTELPGGSFWNIVGLYRDILEGLRRCVDLHGSQIVSIGIDTWGCDFGLIASDGELMGMPHQYRDSRFEGMADAMHELISEDEIFQHTGIKTNFYNTSLHLLAAAKQNNQALHYAESLLFMPDLLAYWLTGVKRNERTIASTSQLLDPRTGEWAWPVIEALGLPKRLFGQVVPPGTVLGMIREQVAEAIGISNIPVVATACHDTASAVAGIPMCGPNQLWLSSGTWSIMGIEAAKPITDRAALRYGFCNELGTDGSVRFLKNISGLWLIQECKREWEAAGTPLSYAQLATAASEVPPFFAFIDPDHESFASPGEMPQKIQAFCKSTGQVIPQTHGEILRVANDSLALKYRSVYDRICELTGFSFEQLNAGGGGIQNTLLSQATANALGIPVLAGPIEATSCGNIITQMLAMGHLDTLSDGRALIRESFEFQTFTPQDAEAWQRAYQQFRDTI